MSKYQANNIGIIGLIQSLISEQNVDRIRLYFLDLQSNQAICNAKNVDGVQQTVLEKTADSFKLAWFTLPDSFKIIWNPCQTVLIFVGFLFTPVDVYSEDNQLTGLEILKRALSSLLFAWLSLIPPAPRV